MVTKEQCEGALLDLKKQLEDILGYESENVECVKVLNQLIEEHFKDKKTLKKRFNGYKIEQL